MTERMSAERLAELELESLRWKYAPRCRELFAALKAERQRAEAARKELDRYKKWFEDWWN